jgi:hypothetical protein
MCPTLTQKRISKSAAAEAIGINRRTVYRYARKQLVSENEKGRVLLSEVQKVWNSPIKRSRAKTPRAMFVPFRSIRDEGERRRRLLDRLRRDFEDFVKRRTALEKAKDSKKVAGLVASVVKEQVRLREILTLQLGFTIAEANKALREETSEVWITQEAV